MPSPTRPLLAEVTTPPGRLRIAYVDEAPKGVAAEGREAARRVAGLCESLGHAVTPVRFPVEWAVLMLALHPLIAAFVAHLTDALCPRFGLVPGADNLEPSNLALTARGRSLSAVELTDALAARDAISRAAGHFFGELDVLLTPTQAAPPPLIGALKLDGDGDEVLDRLFAFAPFTALFNLTGGPAMSVPLHVAEGLPAGVHFGARPGGEATLFRLAGQLEQAAPWADRKPADRRGVMRRREATRGASERSRCISWRSPRARTTILGFSKDSGKIEPYVWQVAITRALLLVRHGIDCGRRLAWLRRTSISPPPLRPRT